VDFVERSSPSEVSTDGWLGNKQQLPKHTSDRRLRGAGDWQERAREPKQDIDNSSYRSLRPPIPFCTLLKLPARPKLPSGAKGGYLNELRRSAPSSNRRGENEGVYGTIRARHSWRSVTQAEKVDIAYGINGAGATFLNSDLRAMRVLVVVQCLPTCPLSLPELE
jgi:hypothetical protein